MPPKKSQGVKGLKKWGIGAICSIVILPALAFGWKNIQAVWASPAKVQKLETYAEKQQETLDKIADVVTKQEAKLDTQEKVTAAQVEALNSSIQLIAEMKKKK